MTTKKDLQFCQKDLLWDDDNDDLPQKDRVCHNCVWQFACKNSDYQPI